MGKKVRRAHEGLKLRKGKENIVNPTPTQKRGSGEAGKALYEIELALIYIQNSGSLSLPFLQPGDQKGG